MGLDFLRELINDVKDWREGPPPKRLKQVAYCWSILVGLGLLWFVQAIGALLPLLLFVIGVFAVFATATAFVIVFKQDWRDF